MMGPSHALTGTALWLGGSLAFDKFGDLHQSPLQIAVGTAICAGGALLPDMDLSGKVTANKGGATVAHTFGVVSLFAAECLEKLSLGVYNITRGPKDPKRHNGHRTLTHTLLFNIGAGAGVAALCAKFGKWAVIGVLFVLFGMAVRGVFPKWSHRVGWITVTLASAAAAYGVYRFLPDHHNYALFGLAVGIGGIAHLLGDMLTSHGTPLLWPIPLGRKLWFCIGLPDRITIETGGAGEVVVFRTVSATVSCVCAMFLMWQPLVDQVTGKH